MADFNLIIDKGEDDLSDLFGKLKTKKTPRELKNEGKEGWGN